MPANKQIVWKHAQTHGSIVKPKTCAFSQKPDSGIIRHTVSPSSPSSSHEEKQYVVPPGKKHWSKQRKLNNGKKIESKPITPPPPPPPSPFPVASAHIEGREIIIICVPDLKKTRIVIQSDDDETMITTRVHRTKIIGFIKPDLRRSGVCEYDNVRHITRKAYSKVHEIHKLKSIANGEIYVADPLLLPPLSPYLTRVTPLADTPTHKQWYETVVREGYLAYVEERCCNTEKLVLELLKISPCIPTLDVLLNLGETIGACDDPPKIWHPVNNVPKAPWFKYDASSAYVECDDICLVKSKMGAWLLKKRLCQMHHGKIYVRVNDVYHSLVSTQNPVVIMLCMYLEDMIHQIDYKHISKMHRTKHEEHYRSIGERMLYDITKDVKSSISIASVSTALENAPMCIQRLIESGVQLLNKHRFQLSASINHTARTWKISPDVLAKPIIEEIERVGTNNKNDRIKQIKYSIRQKQTDKRMCKTRKGIKGASTEIICPFRTTGGDKHMKDCLKTRDYKGSIDTNSMSIQTVWAHTSAKTTSP